ncbi:hypothetical protein B7463_g11352, partial [Scytalidium lignicola]
MLNNHCVPAGPSAFVQKFLNSALSPHGGYFLLKYPRSLIHTNAEESVKNTCSRLECLRGVILVQILQTGLGIVLGLFSEVDMVGNEDHDIMIWANRVHNSKQTILVYLSSSGLDVKELITILSRSTFVTTSFTSGRVEHEVELLVAKLIYYGLIPILRFYIALWLADTWVFFIHRAEHSNQWLYKNFHSRHHELNVPYSWGGIYDHPLESLFLSVGAYVFGVIGSGMTLRESMLFSAFSSVKTCTDHGGYQFPWNPVDLFTTVGAAYHDKHHQRWGLKKNFALHFQFWDRLLGTEFTDAEVASRLYARDREAVEIAREKKREKVKPL